MSMWDVAAMIDGRRYMKRWLLNMAGTGASWDTPTDPTNVVAAAVDGKYYERKGVWYPAAAVPMGTSVDAGVAEHMRILSLKPPEIPWVGVYYSQAGIAAYKVYKQIQGTPLDETLDAMLIFGPPCRAKGVARGNQYAGWEMPGENTKGIADEHFPANDPRIFDFVNRGDIYGEIEDNDVGEDMTMVYRAVQNPKNLVVGKDSAFEQLQELFKSPWKEVPAAAKAIWKGLTFVTTKPWPTYPHTSYQTEPAIRLLNEIGGKWPA
jgi:hypothetical protein